MMRIRNRFRRFVGLAGCCLGVWVACGACLPDSLLITPVQADRPLQKQTLVSESIFPQGTIAVVDVEGVLLNANTASLLRPGEHPVAHLLEELDAARRDPAIRAVILRINSPGGSVTASELMHHEIVRFRASGKPVVAMMMDVAASGGYYIACAADEILACRSTVTGSIGVIMQTFEVTDTMRKLGVKADAIRSGMQKGAGSPFQEMTAEQREVFQDVVAELYEQFVEVVDRGRGELSAEQVRALADGRVYTAPQALAHGLIDRIGTMNDAIERAKALAGLKTAKVVGFARPYRHVPNYYAQAPPAVGATHVNLLHVDLAENSMGRRPPFMYLWSYP